MRTEGRKIDEATTTGEKKTKRTPYLLAGVHSQGERNRLDQIAQIAVGCFARPISLGIYINIDSRPRPIDVARGCGGLRFGHIGHYVLPFEVLAQDTKLKDLLLWRGVDKSQAPIIISTRLS